MGQNLQAFIPNNVVSPSSATNLGAMTLESLELVSLGTKELACIQENSSHESVAPMSCSESLCLFLEISFPLSFPSTLLRPYMWTLRTYW